MRRRYHIQFPKAEGTNLAQDKTYFYYHDSDRKNKIRFHDYKKLYSIPGLYEQVFYDRLKCASPGKVASILESTVRQSQCTLSERRVLDLGAGNGMMGEKLKKYGVSRLIGVDIIPEAYDANLRDRPELYDEYYIEDFTDLDEEKRHEIESWQCDCMVSVAALGFGDIPIKAFLEAYNIIAPDGWVAFNIKETFFDYTDTTGFSRMIRELIWSEYFDVYHIERYRHRLSIDGTPLYYFAIAGRKAADVPTDFLSSKGISD
ncbi:MAG: class I SAM-dependent methyltransferase [Candidatus Electrothrix sp. EH2]|nr:class I SAM-dependent methyltransferase [Candidatus Electrothrix sp. EH2]